MSLEQDKDAVHYDIARLRWQCRRGMLELDTLLEDFLQGCFASLTAAEQSLFIQLLACSDTDLQAWLLDGRPVNVLHLRNIVARVRGKYVVSTPS